MTTNSNHRPGLTNVPGLIKELFAEGNSCSERTIHRLVARREIPYFKLGGKLLFDVDMVRASLEKQASARGGR